MNATQKLIPTSAIASDLLAQAQQMMNLKEDYLRQDNLSGAEKRELQTWFDELQCGMRQLRQQLPVDNSDEAFVRYRAAYEKKSTLKTSRLEQQFKSSTANTSNTIESWKKDIYKKEAALKKDWQKLKALRKDYSTLLALKKLKSEKLSEISKITFQKLTDYEQKQKPYLLTLNQIKQQNNEELNKLMRQQESSLKQRKQTLSEQLRQDIIRQIPDSLLSLKNYIKQGELSSISHQMQAVKQGINTSKSSLERELSYNGLHLTAEMFDQWAKENNH